MARQQYLARAPITEALIDLRVRPRNDLDVSALASLTSDLRDSYPDSEERKVFEGELSLKEGKGRFRTGPAAIYGYFFRSADKTQVFQFRPDGFTFSRLRPYIEWSHVKAEAYGPWREYLAVARPELITRVAVRYINHMALPLPITDFGDYLLSPPKLPEGAPDGISGFLTRITGRYSQPGVSGITANITQSLEPSPDATEKVVVLLDIDVFRANTDYDPTDDQAWNLLDRLRALKNDIFFGSITEPLAELFT